MDKIYKARQGDTWDIVAKSSYNDELKAQLLMENNPKLLHIFVFGGGEQIVCPQQEVTTGVSIPYWRK
nr:MAG TPA: hypothetical protein [Caudoviricetes sp.]